jgi:microcystin-dependent protein
MNHHNFEYSGGIPRYVGDRYYGQDRARDFWAGFDKVGQALAALVGEGNIYLRGEDITEGSSKTEIDIPAQFALVKYGVTIPLSYATLPPTTTTKQIRLPVETEAETDFNLTTAGATLDGVTVNFLKLAYTETDGNSRNKAKIEPPVSYPYERIPGYIITCDSTAPTANEVTIAEIVGDGSTSLAITMETRKNLDNAGGGGDTIPIGVIDMFAMGAVPDSWLECNGAEISRTTYAPLFAVIGTTWGAGDGSTTFNLPDLREATPTGVGTNTTQAIAAHNAVVLGEFQDDQLEDHKHINYVPSRDTGGMYGNAGTSSNNYWLDPGFATGQNNALPLTSDPYSGRTGTTTHGKQVGVVFAIKAEGSIASSELVDLEIPGAVVEEYSIASANVVIDLSSLFAQSSGYIKTYKWSGGDGTYTIRFNGGTYTSKSIAKVDADSLCADMVGRGDGQLSFMTNNGNLEIITKGAYDTWVENTDPSVAPTNPLARKFRQYAYADGSSDRNGAVYDNSITQNEIFNIFDPIIPNIGDHMLLTGAFGSYGAFSVIRRTSATTMTWLYHTTTNGSYTITSGSGTAVGTTFAWASNRNTRWTTLEPKPEENPVKVITRTVVNVTEDQNPTGLIVPYTGTLLNGFLEGGTGPYNNFDYPELAAQASGSTVILDNGDGTFNLVAGRYQEIVNRSSWANFAQTITHNLKRSLGDLRVAVEGQRDGVFTYRESLQIQNNATPGSDIGISVYSSNDDNIVIQFGDGGSYWIQNGGTLAGWSTHVGSLRVTVSRLDIPSEYQIRAR